MKIIESVSQLNDLVDELKGEGKTIGLVPTMGALHKGHLSLVAQCNQATDACIVSIFVNPTQFNNPSDLEHYPRTLQEDLTLLNAYNVEAVFTPKVEEMYPEPDTRVFNFGSLDKVMEAEHRPGHFNGVAQIVSKLFNAVTPDKAFFGEKDFQQLAIIREMVKQENFPIEIVPCPIIREDDGLAMSSRNTRLTKDHRKHAPLISKTLRVSITHKTDFSVSQLKEWVVNNINNDPFLKVEYFDIVNAETLLPVERWDEAPQVIGCIAVFAGEIRLIDNILY